jgi:hypothetical protein
MYLKAVLKRIPLILLLLLLFPLISCTEERQQYLETIPFKDEKGNTLHLRVYPGKDAPEGVTENPGTFFPKSIDYTDRAGSSKSKTSSTSSNAAEDIQTTGVFYIPSPGNVEPDRALGLTCFSGKGGDFTIILFYSDSDEENPSILTCTAPAGEKVEFRVPLDEEKQLVSFEITSPKANEDFELLETGLTEPSRGFRRKNGVLLINPDLRVSSQAPWLLEYKPAAEERASLSHQSSLIIEYELKKGENAFSGELLLTEEKKTESEGGIRYNITFRPGLRRVVLPFPRIGFLPTTVQLKGLNPRNCRILTLEARDALSPRKPIESELGTVLKYPQERWRREEWELYRWSANPHFLILDTVDYAVQAGFFRRLSFFVEKSGFSGSLLTEEELGNMHGWNAHDYRAFDLARFFQLAEENRLDFTPEEKELRAILLKNDILERVDGVYHPGKGGILSISQESPAYLRRKFLIHEGMHGLFFSFPRFREGCFTLWDGLEEEEQQFFRIFLKKMTYDSSQLYLSVNEYQAYMLQQPVEEIEAYFRAHWASRQIWRDYPELGTWYKDNPGIFETRAREVEALLYKTTGFKAADNFCLTEAAADKD